MSYPEILKVKDQEIALTTQAQEEEIRDLRDEIHRKDGVVRELMNSTSWRLTRPLRWLKGMRKP